jgi:hypothetical protein
MKIGINSLMNIAFNTDGVIIDTERFMLEKGLQFFKKKEAKKRNVKLTEIKDKEIIKDKHGYDIREIFDCSKPEEEKFWTRYTLKYI